jgi:tetratricopeptide (TPR) repeat protein
MIPYFYFEFLRTKQAFRLVPIFHHNAIDILSLACLTAIVPFAFRRPEEAPLRHGADMIGLARWLMQTGRGEEALAVFRRAVDLGLPDALLFRTLWDIAAMERHAGRHEAALGVIADLAASRNPYRAKALEEMAKHYERREKNYAMALEMTTAALALGATDGLRKREARLRTRLQNPPAKKRRGPRMNTDEH